MKKYVAIGIVILAFGLVIPACKKTGPSTIDNPYDEIDRTDKTNNGKDSTVSASSIQGLHKNLFKPTCANSGCHDGTFEPDFRTVQSTWSTLVNVKPIKNDSAGTFNARVLPGNSNASILIYRMTVDLGGNSGIMPIVLDPQSDYPSKKTEHLANLKAWIDNGALDMDGKKPVPVDYPPQILGVQAIIGSTIQAHAGKYEPMTVPAGSNVELWFSLADDLVNQSALSNMTINWSTDPDNYLPANEKPLVAVTPKLMAGLYAASTPYAWNYTFSTAGLASRDVIWFRINCSDGKNMNYKIPNTNSMFFLKKYFALRIP